MRRFLLVCTCVTFIVHFPLSGQGTTVVGAGYANPTDIRVSPGQITTIFVSGLTLDPSKPRKATGLPLPNSLAGISVTIKQSSPMLSIVAPLLSIEQLDTCSSGGAPPPPTVPPDCMVGAITLQIPNELSPATRSGDFTVPSTTEMIITAGGATSRGFSISTFTDNLHVLNTCDSFPLKQSGPQIVGGDCRAVVTHADGALVTGTATAKPGEVVVVYAFGLGQTIPAAKTGEATPTPAPVLGGSRIIALQFDFGPNKGPSSPLRPIYDPSVPPMNYDPFLLPHPLFVGLTPGQVGLYQINVQLPSTFPDILPCGALWDPVTGETVTVQSNLTIDIGGISSFDGAAICAYVPLAFGPLPH